MIEQYKSKELTQYDIQQFLDIRAEESIHLEFKTAKEFTNLTPQKLNKFSVITES